MIQLKAPETPLNASCGETNLSNPNLLFLPLAVDCAQRHTPQFRAELGQLGDVVCNLKQERIREQKRQFNMKDLVSELKELQQRRC